MLVGFTFSKISVVKSVIRVTAINKCLYCLKKNSLLSRYVTGGDDNHLSCLCVLSCVLWGTMQGGATTIYCFKKLFLL
jgi:hypothetical protein